MWTYNTFVVLAGVGLLGAAAGTVGSFAVLRRFSLLGDALAHAALPGLCVAFLLTGTRSVPVLLLGALAGGLLGVLTVAGLRRFTKVREDAAIGIVLSVFFGAGIAMSRAIQNADAAGNKAGLDSYILGRTAGILLEDVYLIGGLGLLSSLVVALLFKELQLVSFDPSFAESQGRPVVALDLLLMFLIAVAVVVGLPSVGVVMIAALVVLPGAAARFWTERLAVMVVLSGVIGLLTGVLGATASASLESLPAGPVITLTGTAFFLASAVFAPKRGWIARVRAFRASRLAEPMS